MWQHYVFHKFARNKKVLPFSRKLNLSADDLSFAKPTQILRTLFHSGFRFQFGDPAWWTTQFWVQWEPKIMWVPNCTRLPNFGRESTQLAEDESHWSSLLLFWRRNDLQQRTERIISGLATKVLSLQFNLPDTTLKFAQKFSMQLPNCECLSS